MIEQWFVEPLLMVISDFEHFQEQRTWQLRTLKVANAVAGSNAILQVRLKQVAPDQRRELAAGLRDSVKSGVPLFLNGDPALAVELGFDGFHLPETAAFALGPDPCTLPFTAAAHSATAVRHAESIGAQAAIVSPVYPSRWKPTCPLGVQEFRRIVRQASLPIIALGGMTPRRAPECLRAGAKGIASLSGIMAHAEPAKVVGMYLTILKQFRCD